MNTRCAGVRVATAVSAVLGSVHADRVLAREDGPAYTAYCRRVPMLLPTMDGAADERR